MSDFTKVYADNAATTRLSSVALEAMLPWLGESCGNPSSLHSFGQEAARALAQSRETVAQAIGAQSSELYFTSGGSEADNQAIISAAHAGARYGRRHIISSAFEHHAVLHTLDALRAQGFEITLLEVHSGGLVRVEELKDALREDTALVSIMLANNEIGTVQPVSEIGALCRERGVLFHTDAVQAVGHIPVDVEKMNIDLLSLSAHKFHGPKGVGALYARRGVQLRSLIHGGAQERGKRAGTENVAGAAGMAAALDEAVRSMERDRQYIRSLRDRLASELSKIPHSKINGDQTQCLPGTLNICFEGIEGESLLLMLDDCGIAASSGSACTSGSLDPSHVLLALGLTHELAHGSLRLSLSRYNTPEEIEHIIDCVPEIVNRLRDMSPVWEELEKGLRPHCA